MTKSSKPIFTSLRYNLEVVIFIAVSLAVVFAIGGCEADIVKPDANSMIKMEKGTANSMTGPVQTLVSGLLGASGSAIGPGGDLFVTQGAIGEISRIDPKTGDITTFASGLPPSIIGVGGVVDVAFLGGKAYALVTLVGPQFGTSDVVGIYRIDGPDSYTIIADIGEFSQANPSNTPYVVVAGVQYSIQTFRGGFLVADGHHNRVLQVTLDGEITVFKAFGNTVPTGLEVSGNTVYMAEAGPIPHKPEDGKVVSFSANSPNVSTVAVGAPLLVDVEFNRGRTLYALAQGIWDGVAEGSPAEPNTGSLVRVNDDGTFTSIAGELDRPTSLEFINNTAYIVSLAGEVLTIENVSGPPYGL